MAPEVRVAVLEAKHEQSEKHLDRIDVSIEKLTEVSASLKEIVRNHEEKHIAQVQENKDLKSQIEERRKFSEAEREKIYSHISDVQSNLQNSINELSNDFSVGFDSLKEKIGNNTAVFDKYKWLIIGGGGVVFLLIDKLPIVETLAKLLPK
ncbi:hypothetical protein [Caulobacter phage Cr30]|uniref:hypothetical protein n=1 Tax=Caulobacter phage Cr30 TaxID=1357714 RepID=UPI0004A9B670|nr:hypothetical protein OZ74_gp057 [Caulobacter phage Cr30]AGS80942.1 hypothetical protein [Caulobacter phage Cr30]